MTICNRQSLMPEYIIRNTTFIDITSTTLYRGNIILQRCIYSLLLSNTMLFSKIIRFSKRSRLNFLSPATVEIPWHLEEEKGRRRIKFLTSDKWGPGCFVRSWEVFHPDTFCRDESPDSTIRVKTVRQMKFLPTVGVPRRIESCRTWPTRSTPIIYLTALSRPSSSAQKFIKEWLVASA